MTASFWQDLTSQEIKKMCHSQDVIAILPLSAIEQHGSHLPVSVDYDINQGLLSKFIQQCPSELTVTVLPTIPIGYSPEHKDFSGTLSLPYKLLMDVWMSILEAVIKHGVKKILLFNSHGGQSGLMKVLAQEIRSKYDVFISSVNWYRLIDISLFFDEKKIKHDIHAGVIETSLMLSLYPEKVTKEEVKDYPLIPKDTKELSHSGNISYAWQAQDLNTDGALGMATQACQKTGHKIVEECINKLINLVREINERKVDY